MLPLVFCNDLIFPEYRQRSVTDGGKKRLQPVLEYFNTRICTFTSDASPCNHGSPRARTPVKEPHTVLDSPT